MSSIIQIETVSRQILWFIVHCSYTKENQNVDVDTIRRWHLNRGWSDIGYNYYVTRDGEPHFGRSLKRYGAHTVARQANRKSIGICYEGGMSIDGKPEDNIMVEQVFTILGIFKDAQLIYPGIKLGGHNQFDAKACPCLDVRDYGLKMGLSRDEILMDEPKVVSGW